MMKRRVRLLTSIAEIILGVVLTVCGGIGLTDEYWSGMGTALLVIGILQLIRHIRYKTNESYRQNVDTERNDERNKYLSLRAWAWSGYLYVLIAALGTIALKLADKEELMRLASGSVCLIVLLYWISYMILRKKY